MFAVFTVVLSLLLCCSLFAVAVGSCCFLFVVVAATVVAVVLLSLLLLLFLFFLFAVIAAAIVTVVLFALLLVIILLLVAVVRRCYHLFYVSMQLHLLLLLLLFSLWLTSFNHKQESRYSTLIFIILCFATVKAVADGRDPMLSESKSHNARTIEKPLTKNSHHFLTKCSRPAVAASSYFENVKLHNTYNLLSKGHNHKMVESTCELLFLLWIYASRRGSLNQQTNKPIKQTRNKQPTNQPTKQTNKQQKQTTNNKTKQQMTNKKQTAACSSQWHYCTNIA